MKVYKLKYGIDKSDTMYSVYILGDSPEDCKRQLTKEIENRGGNIQHWYSCDYISDIHLITDTVKKQIIYNSPILVDNYNKEVMENQIENKQLNDGVKQRIYEKSKLLDDLQEFKNKIEG